MLSASLIQLEYASKQWKSTFSYSPLVLWWPPLSHFQEKGNFSWPFLGFHIYFKIPIVSLTQKNGAHHGCCSFAALFVTIPTEDSALMALLGLLWLGWVSLGACQNMCMCIPPSKTQRNTNPTQDTLYPLAWVLVNLLATCDLF